MKMHDGFSLELCQLEHTGQGVGLQDDGALGGRRWQLEVVQVLSAVQQSPAELRQRQQQGQEVGGRHAVEGFGAGAEIQSSLKKAAHPLLVLRSSREERCSQHSDLHQGGEPSGDITQPGTIKPPRRCF